MRPIKPILLAAVLLTAACTGSGPGRPTNVAYPVVGWEEPAILVIQLTHAVSNAHLSINGHLVTADAHTSIITVTDIPPGDVAVVLAADGVEKAFGVRLEPGQRMVVPVAVATAPKTTHPLIQALLAVAVYASYMALASLF